MFTFDIQRFDATYNLTDLATVGQIKTLATRVATRLAALESPKAFRGAKIEDNKLKFYESTDTSVNKILTCADFDATVRKVAGNVDSEKMSS